MKTTTLKISEIKNNPNNPRLIKDDKFKKLVTSIQEFPEMLDAREIVVNKDYIILGGNMRFKAAKEAGLKEVPVKIVDWSEEKQRQFIIKDNVSGGEWDWDILANEWEAEELDAWGLDTPDGWGAEENEIEEDDGSSLSERFIIPPFSVFDTKQGYWQDRKRAWTAIGIKSELGRGGEDGKGSIGGNGASLGAGLQAKRGKDGKLEYTPILKRHEMVDAGGGTSIFDPVLCEVAYRWFNVPNGTILDPFAGGSVRGVVASRLGYSYTGHELRREQVEANRLQGDELCNEPKPKWIVGDSNKTLDEDSVMYDMVFSCPPYADLEVYSDDKADISNMPYDEFLLFYKSIIKKAVGKLKDDRFIVWVVGEVRSKGGGYYNLVSDTVECFEEAGASYYNEIILLNSIGSLPMRSARAFIASRKIGKCHQNIMVFYKGNPKNIKSIFGTLDFSSIEEMLEESAV